MEFKEIHTKDLLKIYFSKFDYSLVNKDGKITFTNKDNFDTGDLNYCICLSDFEVVFSIKDELLRRLSNYSKKWLQVCYHYDFDTFLSNIGLSQYNYNRLLKLERS